MSKFDYDQSPSRFVSDNILSRVKRDLEPSAVMVFSKLMSIHVLSALATLSVCPQFGFRVFGNGMGLMHYFMSLGEYGCLVACGTFFTSTSLFVSGVVLSKEELRSIRKNRWLELGGLVMLSLGFFIMNTSNVVFGLTAAWFLGAMLGSQVMLEIVWRIRTVTNEA